mgnify:FL=1
MFCIQCSFSMFQVDMNKIGMPLKMVMSGSTLATAHPFKNGWAAGCMVPRILSTVSIKSRKARTVLAISYRCGILMVVLFCLDPTLRGIMFCLNILLVNIALFGYHTDELCFYHSASMLMMFWLSDVTMDSVPLKPGQVKMSVTGSASKGK